MKKLTLFLLVSLCVMGMSVMPSYAADPKYGGSATYGTTGDIHKLDLHKATSDMDFRTFSLALNNLVEVGLDNLAKPALAESWDVSEDGKTWTFHLRKGVKWHNGREMVADDIKWNFSRLLDPKIGASFAKKFTMVSKVEVVDKSTIRFLLNKPSGVFLSSFITSPTQPQMMAPESLNEDGSITHPIGTGPFEFVEWKQNEHVKFKRFKDYWRKGLPYLDQVIVKPIPDNTVRMTGIRTGDIDAAFRLPIPQVVEMMKKSHKDYHFDIDTIGGTALLIFNLSKPPFNDVRVRQAVAYGINREELLQGIYFGHGWTTDQQFDRQSRWHCDLPVIKQDPAKAKELLKAAGYPDGLEVEIATTPSFRYPLATAQIIQAQLQQVGLKLKLDVNDLPSWFNKLIKGNFKMSVFGFSELGDPDRAYRYTLHKEAPGAWMFGKAYKNETLSKLLDQATEVTDFKERKALYCQVVKIMHEECPMIYTTKGKAATGMRDRLKGYVPHSFGTMVYGDGGFQYAWVDD